MIAAVARVRHFRDEINLHLPLVIEWRTRLHQSSLFPANLFGEILQRRRGFARIIRLNAESRARHNHGSIRAKETLAEVISDVDWRGVESEIALGFSGALHPINVIARGLTQKNGDLLPNFQRAPVAFGELLRRVPVFDGFNQCADFLAHPFNRSRDGVLDEIRAADSQDIPAICRLRAFARRRRFGHRPIPPARKICPIL